MGNGLEVKETEGSDIDWAMEEVKTEKACSLFIMLGLARSAIVFSSDFSACDLWLISTISNQAFVRS